MGSVSGGGGCSLLGADELERYFPDRKLRVFCATWNMCEARTVPASVNDFILPDRCTLVHDVYVIGTQESVSDRYASGHRRRQSICRVQWLAFSVGL